MKKKKRNIIHESKPFYKLRNFVKNNLNAFNINYSLIPTAAQLLLTRTTKCSY